MSFLTPEQKTTLLNLLTANGLENTESSAAANTLNESRTATATRSKPFSVPDILGKISGQHQAAIMALPVSTLAIQAMKEQDRDAVAMYAGAFKGAGLLSDQEHTDISAVLAATEEYDAPAPTLFEAAMGDFYHVVDGVGYAKKATAALIEEARS